MGFGINLQEIVKNQLNFRGSDTLEKRDVCLFSAVKLRVQSGTHQKWQNEPLGP